MRGGNSMTSLIRLVLVISLQSSFIASQSCPSGYQNINGDCYFISTESKTWDVSQNACYNNHNGDLVVFRSLSNLGTLAGQLVDGQTYWVGLKESQNTPGWSWLDGQPVDYDKWSANEPSDDRPEGQDCGQYFFRNWNWGWNDYPCAGTSSFVCVKGRNQDGSCSHPFSAVSNQCYFVPNYATNWYNARQYCIDNNANLPLVRDWSTHSGVTGLLYESYSYWIGMAEDVQQAGWRWVTNQHVTYSIWDANRPLTPGTNRHCGHYLLNSYGWWRWSDRLCTDNLHYVCEKSAVSGCTDGFIYKNGKCYMISQTQIPWDDARSDCKNQGADLAVVQNSRTHWSLTGSLNGYRQYWIGLEPGVVTSTPGWNWVGGTLVNQNQWSAESPSDPNPNSKDCGYISKTNILWTDASCIIGKRYICQTATRVTTPPPATTTTTPPPTTTTTTPPPTTTTTTPPPPTTTTTTPPTTTTTPPPTTTTTTPSPTTTTTTTPPTTTTIPPTTTPPPTTTTTTPPTTTTTPPPTTTTPPPTTTTTTTPPTTTTTPPPTTTTPPPTTTTTTPPPTTTTTTPLPTTTTTTTPQPTTTTTTPPPTTTTTTPPPTTTTTPPPTTTITTPPPTTTTTPPSTTTATTPPTTSTTTATPTTTAISTTPSTTTATTSISTTTVSTAAATTTITNPTTRTDSTITTTTPDANTTPTTTTIATATTPTPITTNPAIIQPPPTPDNTPMSPESIEFLKNMTSPAINTTSPNNLCPCNCQKFDPNPPPDVLADIILKIHRKLVIADTNSLSSRRNKKTCAEDERPESKFLGYVGVCLAVIPVCVIVVFDVMRVFHVT